MLIGNVSEQAWRRWEAGTRSVPDDVAVRIRHLVDWRSTAIKTAVHIINAAPDGAQVAPIWYASLDDWISLAGREADLWRPQQSVVAALLSLSPERVSLVRFDGLAYATWLAGREDSETMRSCWGASVR